MALCDGIDPEYYTLLSESEKLLATLRLKRQSEPVDWQELHELQNEVSRMADKMQAMILSASETKTIGLYA